MRVLVIGSSGWIGSQCVQLLRSLGHEVVDSNIRIDNYGSIGLELDSVKPSHVILAAGKTGRPNVDWCEDNKIETLETNTLGTGVVFSETHRRALPCYYLGTGCIYEYDDEHQINGIGFTEDDEPNFEKSWYSHTKLLAEKISKPYPNVCVLRIRMPISSDFSPRSFITKIVNYQKVVDVPNSMTVLDDLLPLIPVMMERQIFGIWNFCNQGTLSHNEILSLYEHKVDPEHQTTNFTLDEQAKILKTGRSNNALNCSKLMTLFPNIPHIKDSIITVINNLAHLKSNQSL